jgi:hypothetical protein
MNQFPFRKDPNPDLTRTISEIVAPKAKTPKPQPKKPDPKGDKYDKGAVREGTEGDVHGGGATSPPPRRSKTIRTPRVMPVRESHTRAQLEKLSTTRLRELKKKYEGLVLRGDKDASRELADVRGILRSKGAGHALDEARKGIRKTRYGQALQRLGDAAARIKANPPKPPVNPFKTPVKEEMTPCERNAMGRLKAANAEDLKDKPGAAGEKAHKRLHKTIGKILKGK